MEQTSLQFAPEKHIFSVQELNASIRATLESDFRDVRVAGEISGTRLATSGHCYFTLKDRDAAVKCVCYRSAYRYLKCKPKDGVAVVLRGQVGVFEARGEYQIQVESIEPRGHGALQAAFEDLKKRLGAEGLFDSARKRNLPAYPRRIGIVTSPQGAVISDILHVLERRFPGLHVRLYPAKVQGEGSVAEVCAGIEYFGESAWPDVVIVARGGGSLEDLSTFNTEAVARAIAASPVPVISAVGHETDVTIADFAADVRAPTPSAAAAIVCPQRQDILDRIEARVNRMTRMARYKLASASNQLQKRGVERAAAALARAIGRRLQWIDDREYRMKDCIRRKIEQGKSQRAGLLDRLRECDQRPKLARGRRRLETAHAALIRIVRREIDRRRNRVELCRSGLIQMGPLQVLQRGYALVSAMDGSILRSAGAVEPGQDIQVRLAAGRLLAKVTDKDD